MADWDTRYRERSCENAPRPHDLLVRFAPLIPKGRVIDIASGSGKDIIFLAEQGYRVCGLDRSREALKIARQAAFAGRRSIDLVLGDASTLPFKKGSASAVLVFYFLLREIMAEIMDLLEKGGILIYETLLNKQGMTDSRRNPDYLLEEGELPACFDALELLFYEEAVTSFEGKERAVARYVGRKR